MLRLVIANDAGYLELQRSELRFSAAKSSLQRSELLV
jgi:hypothetical protein